jgi:deoxyribodipyrimidine photolyase-related protein
MSRQCLIILPIHLFEYDTILEKLKENSINTDSSNHLDIFIIEEPIYFGDRTLDNKLPTRTNPPLNYNKLKLIYHRASMKYYESYLKLELTKEKYQSKLEYIDYKTLKTKTNAGYKFASSYDKIYCFDPIDSLLDAKYTSLFKNKIKYLDTPLFLCTNKDLEDYNKTKKTKGSYFHASFYTWQRKRLNILPNSKTYDTENRNMLPLTEKIPPLPSTDSSTVHKRHLSEAITYINKLFPDNLQPLDKPITIDSIHFPISHKTSETWVKHFCANRFENFGKYEDSIDSRPKNFLFHSCISPMLNIGLITPQQVVTIISDYYNKHKGQIGIANYEGFIRQIIGWREYQRYIYQYAGNLMRSGNHFGNRQNLSHHWYDGTLGVKPVDDAIKLAVNDGYIHHILRLMVVGNFMNLVGIHPHHVYKWFMEFSLDSYDWVMVGNVYSMALWADGGLTMRKPYISSSGYIVKMGNFSKSREEWHEIWDSVFHHFIDRNSGPLSKTYYNGLVKAWNNKPKKEKDDELKIAEDFLGGLHD